MRVAFQGEPGAFSEEAVLRLFPDAEPVARRSFRAVFEAVTERAVERGLVPLENSTVGSINETYDLLAAGETHIVGEVIVRVDHALLALPGTGLEEVRLVRSHPQALAQCQEFLAELGVEAVPVYDTAGAAKQIAEERRAGEAAVAAARAAGVYGLAVLAEAIQDDRLNQTRFAAIALDPTPIGPPDKTSLVFRAHDIPGALYHCLEPFARLGLNLSKLESRPSGDVPWQYRSYLDVEAGDGDPRLAEALDVLKEFTAEIHVLGSYPRWME